jgi:hypothetical protein
MELNELKRDLDMLITHIQMKFENMLYAQKEYIIFNEDDLQHDTPDDYLEMRDYYCNVFDIHPLKVVREDNNHYIDVVTADGEFTKHRIRIYDIVLEDRIKLLELMEQNLED